MEKIEEELEGRRKSRMRLEEVVKTEDEEGEKIERGGEDGGGRGGKDRGGREDRGGEHTGGNEGEEEKIEEVEEKEMEGRRMRLGEVEKMQEEIK